MVAHAIARALESGATRLTVATNHSSVAEAVKYAGGEAFTISVHYSSGTERPAEVIEQHGFADDTIIVHVEGDVSLIPPLNIRQRGHDDVGGADRER